MIKGDLRLCAVQARVVSLFDLHGFDDFGRAGFGRWMGWPRVCVALLVEDRADVEVLLLQEYPLSLQVLVNGLLLLFDQFGPLRNTEQREFDELVLALREVLHLLVGLLLVVFGGGLDEVRQPFKRNVLLLLQQLLQLLWVETLEDVRLEVEVFLEDLVVHGLGLVARHLARLVVFLLHLLHELVEVYVEILE